MEHPFQTGSPTVDQMSRLQITGNIIPAAWFKTIRKETGKPNLNAIILLSDIVYWYRPVEVRDEMTGQLIGLKKKFRADLLQRSYQQMAEQFGFSKRDATNAIVELEKAGVIKRVFRTLQAGGQQIPNVLFLDLNVETLERLTYPDNMQRPDEKSRCPPNRIEVSPKTVGGVPEISDTLPPIAERGGTETGDTNTEIINREYLLKNVSYPSMLEWVKGQVSYDALKHDHPYDTRIDEIVEIMADVMSSDAETIRVNKENKPAAVVKGQFAKLSMQHLEYVLKSLDENHTKARNIRAVLITALYNSVFTISSYYGNLVQYHLHVGTQKEEAD